MACTAAMVGNSSSGIFEAPSFGLPVVNIGTRQQGRLRAENVLDTGYHRDDILHAIQKAVTPVFLAQLRDLRNPYGDGHAAERIVSRLKEVRLDDRLIMKRFVDSPRTSDECRPLGKHVYAER
jgi:UDP-N-acetylglucosamine 2-epimerase